MQASGTTTTQTTTTTTAATTTTVSLDPENLHSSPLEAYPEAQPPHRRSAASSYPLSSASSSASAFGDGSSFSQQQHNHHKMMKNQQQPYQNGDIGFYQQNQQQSHNYYPQHQPQQQHYRTRLEEEMEEGEEGREGGGDGYPTHNDGGGGGGEGLYTSSKAVSTSTNGRARGRGDEEEEDGGDGRETREKGKEGNGEPDSGGDGSGRPKKRRKYINKACDNCRARHSRCDGKERCSQCVKKGFVCSYSAPPTRRGPVSERQLQDLIAQLTKQIESEKKIKKNWKDKYFNRTSGADANPTVPAEEDDEDEGTNDAGAKGELGLVGSRGAGGSSRSGPLGPGWPPGSSPLSPSSAYMSQGWEDASHLAITSEASTFLEAYNRYITRHISAHPLVFEPGNLQRVLSSQAEHRTPLAFQMFAVLANGARVTRNVTAGKEFSLRARSALGAVFDQTDALVAQGLMILSYYMSGEAEADKTMYYLQLARKMCQHLKSRTSEYYMLILMTIGFASPHTEEKMEVFSELKMRLTPLLEAQSASMLGDQPASSSPTSSSSSSSTSSSSNRQTPFPSSAENGDTVPLSPTSSQSAVSNDGVSSDTDKTAGGATDTSSSSSGITIADSSAPSLQFNKSLSYFTITLAIISVQLELELVKLPTDYSADYTAMLQVLDKLKRRIQNDKDTSYSKLGFLIFLEVIRAQCYCNLGLREMAVECTNKVSELAKHEEFIYCPIGVLGGVAMMATIQLQENKVEQVRDHIARMQEMASTYPFVRFMAQKLQEALQDKLSKPYEIIGSDDGNYGTMAGRDGVFTDVGGDDGSSSLAPGSGRRGMGISPASTASIPIPPAAAAATVGSSPPSTQGSGAYGAPSHLRQNPQQPYDSTNHSYSRQLAEDQTQQQDLSRQSPSPPPMPHHSQAYPGAAAPKSQQSSGSPTAASSSPSPPQQQQQYQDHRLRYAPSHPPAPSSGGALGGRRTNLPASSSSTHYAPTQTESYPPDRHNRMHPSSTSSAPSQHNYQDHHMVDHMMGQPSRFHLQDNSYFNPIHESHSLNQNAYISPLSPSPHPSRHPPHHAPPQHLPASSAYHHRSATDYPFLSSSPSAASSQLPHQSYPHRSGSSMIPSGSYDYDRPPPAPSALDSDKAYRHLPSSSSTVERHGLPLRERESMISARHSPSASPASSAPYPPLNEQEEYRRLQQQRYQLEQELRHERHGLQLQQQQQQQRGPPPHHHVMESGGDGDGARGGADGPFLSAMYPSPLQYPLHGHRRHHGYAPPPQHHHYNPSAGTYPPGRGPAG